MYTNDRQNVGFPATLKALSRHALHAMNACNRRGAHSPGATGCKSYSPVACRMHTFGAGVYSLSSMLRQLWAGHLLVQGCTPPEALIVATSDRSGSQKTFLAAVVLLPPCGAGGVRPRAAAGMVYALQGRASGGALLSRSAARAAALRRAPQCLAQRLVRRHASSSRAVASRAPARAHDSAATVSRRVEARSSAFSSLDASDSFNSDESTAPPRFLLWCRSAQAETRAINYVLNGSMIALVLTASATKLLELTRGDFFSAHASLEGVLMALNQSWEAYARAVDAHPLSTKVRWPWALCRPVPFSQAVPMCVPVSLPLSQRARAVTTAQTARACKARAVLTSLCAAKHTQEAVWQVLLSNRTFCLHRLRSDCVELVHREGW